MGRAYGPQSATSPAGAHAASSSSRHGTAKSSARARRLAAGGAVCVSTRRPSTLSRCAGDENSSQSKLCPPRTGTPRRQICRPPAPVARRPGWEPAPPRTCGRRPADPGGGQRRAQPREPRGQWLAGRQPLVLQLIDGDEPARDRPRRPPPNGGCPSRPPGTPSK